MAKNMPSREEVRQLFDYVDGALIWRVDRGHNKTKGEQAGYYDHRGYNRIGINKRNYLAHRLIWVWHNGEISGVIDHIDRNPFNNEIENLRECSQMDNLLNSRAIRNKLGFRGIGFHRPSKKFHARIMRAGTTESLGYFSSAEEAGRAYEEAHKRRYNDVFNANQSALVA